MGSGGSATLVKIQKAECLYLQVALPGQRVENAGVFLYDPAGDQLFFRLRRDWDAIATPDDAEVLKELDSDFRLKIRDLGARGFLEQLEDKLSHVLRLTDREAMQVANFESRLNRLFRDHVTPTVVPFRTHVPFYPISVAAGHLGEAAEAPAEPDEWLLTPDDVDLTENMFAAKIWGRSMEPLIPDGSICLFRTPVVGSRNGRRLLIEKFGERDSTTRYTIKRYTSGKKQRADETWEHEWIRLEPLNPEYEPWFLEPDQFRVVAEFVRVLPEDGADE